MSNRPLSILIGIGLLIAALILFVIMVSQLLAPAGV
jgi:hypothetical protein